MQGPYAYTAAEVAERLRVDRRTIYMLMKRGELRSIRVGRGLRIPAEALDDFIHAGSRPGLPANAERRKRLSPEERERIWQSLFGSLPDLISSEEYIAEKQREKAREEAHYRRILGEDE